MTTLRNAYTIPASTRVFGPWSGSLNNGGERVTLEDKNGVLMWHPGAAKWFKENAGADIPDNMIHGM